MTDIKQVSQRERDEKYMRMALELAVRGRGWVSPNPVVGAVIVKKDAEGRETVIGQGYHERYGELHAERNALAACTESPAGATIYVTLEPCCHHGRQPPCTDAILEAGIRRVVVGSSDPNPLVCGKGIRILREQGVEVTEGVLKEDCDRENVIFFHYIGTRMPYVVMKYAMTIDGKIAAFTGNSKWITGEEARQHVHRQRHNLRGIMVGVGTVIADDPQLTCRLPGTRNPVRIICDTWLRTPLDAKVVTTAGEVPTILATCCEDPEVVNLFTQRGCRVMTVGREGNHLDLRELMYRLGQEKIDSILLEGGSTLNWSALESGLVNRVMAYVAPKLFGGRDAKTPVEGRGVTAPQLAYFMKNTTVTKLGDDFLIEGTL
ncbi:MAG: bifunctional diaminohydroxyphosphoribosylaminopyrimidine deaminase/5-amino-6-(5-phosphoribosylamino)uracil reductase RibD [Eubacteriales bacterium]|nr:bifunctional diaminohydroxyphosphoribosylaminopyrimidine deaminase/5-amino-6-(5-phosphoribosylamino)uracil reductase RibD [Eubacteriales bacterium]